MIFKAIHRGRITAPKISALGIACLAWSTLAASAADVSSAEPLAVTPTVAAATMEPILDDFSPPATATEAEERSADADIQQSEKNCLATAIYFEARGETTRGQRAVAEVILTRAHARGRPKTICGVVYEGSRRATGCQFSFTCDRIPDVVRDSAAWSRAQRVANAAMRKRGKGKAVARGATNYHAAYVTPYWASHMVKVAQIGTHIFYR